MRVKKFSHMKGGKVLEICLVLSVIFLIVVAFLLFRDMEVGFVSAFILLVIIGLSIRFVYRFYKPAFTDVIFSDDRILSKTHFEQSELAVNDIKGIWYYKNVRLPVLEMNPYSEEADLKGCIVVIGDLAGFDNARSMDINGSRILCDTFGKGYTTLVYRKALDEVLNHYSRHLPVVPETE